MLIPPNIYGFSNKKKYVVGRGFVDTLSSMLRSISGAFRNVAGPTIKSIGAYAHANKDLIARPVLGALGSLAATGLTSGIPAIIKRIAGKKKKVKAQNTVTTPQAESLQIPEETKFREILENISGTKTQSSQEATPRPVSDIVGSGHGRSGPRPIRDRVNGASSVSSASGTGIATINNGRSNRIIRGSGIKKF